MASHRGRRIARQGSFWLMLLLLVATAGCRGSGTVAGKVKYKGNPVPSGQVVFFDSNNKQLSTASISNDGSYSATVPSGTLKVAIIVPPSTTLKSMPDAKSKQIADGIKKMKKGTFNPLESESQDLIPQKVISIPAKYADPTNSGLTITVAGGPQSFDLDLQ
jgi:hypothetical protein